jgi:hypothetical protein
MQDAYKEAFANLQQGSIITKSEVDIFRQRLEEKMSQMRQNLDQFY